MIKASTANSEHRLLVFIPGTNLTAGQSGTFLQTAAAAGFDVVGVNYANSQSVATVCGTDAACFGKYRHDVVFGGATAGRGTISAAASIVGRLKSAIATAGFADSYLDSSGEPLWGSVVASGHSQGAGHAAVLGQFEPVARVSLIAGPNDLANGKIPPWVTRAPAPASWFALGHAEDDSYNPKQLPSWNKFKIPSANRTIETYGGVSDEHLSLVIDGQLGPTTTLVPDWKVLIGNTGGD